MKYSIPILLIFLIGCQNKETSFIWSDKDNASLERSFQEVIIEDSLDLDELEKFSILDLIQDENYIFILVGGDNEILRVQKNDFQMYHNIAFKEGRGPGEILAINDYDVNNSFLMIFDQEQQKIVFFDKQGNFVKEFVVEDVVIDRIKFLDNDKLLTYSMRMNEYQFHIIDFQGTVHNSFNRLDPELNFLMYSGDIFVENEHFYFAGYSEPILKKYSLENEEQIYSVSVIDAYESSANYIQSESGGFNMTGYAPGALYASLGVAVDNNKIYTTPHHNDTPGYNYIDIYDTENGQYLSSFQLKHYPKLRGIQVENNHIYSIESRSNYNWLLKYRIK